MEEREILGHTSTSRLWVVGDTVRREREEHSDTVAALLRHLEERGYPYSPRYLGVDDRGRDVLSLLPGTPVPTLRGDDQLREVGAVVAGFARAVEDFRAPPGAVWRNPEGWPQDGETVVHTDIALWNLLESDGRVTGLVDFDSARPGRALEDVAYAAWIFTPLDDAELGDGTRPDQPRRLRLFVDACGLDAPGRAALLDEVARVEVTLGARVAAGARNGDPTSERHWAGGRMTRNLARSLLWLDEHHDALARALR